MGYGFRIILEIIEYISLGFWREKWAGDLTLGVNSTSMIVKAKSINETP